MNKNKIAILTDSGSDVPKEYLDKYDNIYVAPLNVIYSYGQFQDGINITPEEVCESLEKEIPTTSLPSGEVIKNIFNKIKEDGYEKVLVTTISSGLSGTFNMINLVATDYKELDIRFIDTKNIGIGSGFSGVLAADLIEKGLDIDELEEEVKKVALNTQVFFCVSTLEYLIKGGRIGKVTAVVGKAFDIKPVISCNEDGIYHTVSKQRGKRRALAMACKLAALKAKGHKYNIAVAHAGAVEEAKKVEEKLKEMLPNYEKIITGSVSPALVVHTGPGLIGVGIQILD